MNNLTFKARRKQGPIRLASLGAWGISILFFLPVAWIMSAALKPKNIIEISPPVFIFKPTFQNITEALRFDNTLDYFIHTLLLIHSPDLNQPEQTS
jgi:ABC-type glycerol-3-phosphate transport system permease component